MKILFAAAEVEPFSKVGGLADVAGSLPATLASLGHDIRVVTPGHLTALPYAQGAPTRQVPVPTPRGLRDVPVATVKAADGVPVDLVIDNHYFGRDAVYGEPDDLLRYQFFCRAIVGMLQSDEWKPDVLHLNDWHTAPLAFALRSLAWAQPELRGIASLFTIHNLRYRGPDWYNDFLAQAIYYADGVTTVSPTHAREILTRDYGEGLESLLQLREDCLTGILNGLDYDLYDPRNDPALAANFDLASLRARDDDRRALAAELGFDPPAGPLLAMVTRLSEQKGIDLAIASLPTFAAADARLIVLGVGEAALESELRELTTAMPGALTFVNRFDESLARRIYAGSDIFLMPSRYEPCGLGQLIAMRYGCVPIGRRTGGLADTILDPEEHPDHATGFLFSEASPFALSTAFERALTPFRDPTAWARLQSSGMSTDYSWRASANHYVEAYVAALRRRGIIPLD